METASGSRRTAYAHRVSYGETDAMGVMYYAQYLHVFERARSQFIRECGMSYAEVEERGLFLPVREARCRYRSPARYDQELVVHAGITQWGRASLVFEYRVVDAAAGTLVAEGMTEHACVAKDGKPTRVPDWLKDLCA